MKIKSSLKNMITSIISNMVNVAMGLITQAIFIKTLGNEILGLNGLFCNVISLLNIAELGINSSIVFHLYKPIANKDIEKQKSLLQFHKTSYEVIGIIIFILGILIIPILPFLIKDNNLNININLAYILVLMSTVSTYFLVYKRNILYANQQNYILNIIHIFYLIILNIIQIVLLLITKNYYIYLLIFIIMNVIENLVITFIVNRKFSYLKSKEIKKLDRKEKKNIFKMIKAMFFHKIGTFVVNGTDNIIISKFLGLATVGLYTNYYMIMNALRAIVFNIVKSTTASVGNMLVTENEDKHFDIFKKIRFMNFWLSTFTSVGLFIILESFIKIWIGEQYLLSKLVLITLVINFFFYSSRIAFFVFKDAAGLYYEDRYVPLFESVTNIVFSLLFIKYFGLSGVILGTIVSSFWLHFYSFPIYVYKKLFKRQYFDYLKETIGYLFLFIIILIISSIISNLYIFDNVYIEFFKNCFITLLIPNIILIVLFFNTNNFKYFLSILKNLKFFKEK